MGEAHGRSQSLVSRALLGPLSTRLALVVGVASLLLPREGMGIPLCWFKGLYGLPCPGCGMTRSLTNLSQLHFAEGLAYHPFGLVVWPLVVFLALLNFVGARRRERVAAWLDERARGARLVYFGLVGAFLCFGLARLAVALIAPEAVAGI